MFLLVIFAVGAASAADDVNATDSAVISDDSALDDTLQSDDEDNEGDDEYTDVDIDMEPKEEFVIGDEDFITIGFPVGWKGDLSVTINDTATKLEYVEDQDGDGNIYAYFNQIGSETLRLPVEGDDPDDNEYYISLDRLPPGVYNVVVKFKTTSKTYSKSSVITLYGPDHTGDEVDIELEDTYHYAHSTNRITITSPAKYIDSLDIKINGVRFDLIKKSNTEGYVDISRLDPGEYKIVVRYNGGKNFTEEEFDVVTDIYYPEEMECGNAYYVSLTLFDGAQGNLTVQIDGKLIGNKKLVNGKAEIPIPELPVGYYWLVANYTGTDFDISGVRDIIEVNPRITLPARMIVGEDKYLTIYVGDTSGTAYIETDDGYHKTIKVNRVASISLANMDDGVITISVSYVGDDGITYMNAEDYDLIVDELSRRIVGAHDIKMTYGEDMVYKFTLYGPNGRAAEETELVEIVIGNKKYEGDIDRNGVVTFKIPNTVAPGKYTMKILYEGSSVENNLFVNHLLKLKNAKVKKSAKSVVLKATLKKGMKNKKVTFKFNNKKFKAKTNKKGVAKVTIKPKFFKKLKPGKKVNYQATYFKDTVKKTVKVKK